MLTRRPLLWFLYMACLVAAVGLFLVLALPFAAIFYGAATWTGGVVFALLFLLRPQDRG